jgi:hypothetical protein
MPKAIYPFLIAGKELPHKIQHVRASKKTVSGRVRKGRVLDGMVNQEAEVQVKLWGEWTEWSVLRLHI